jgi:hypothetical protein
MCVDWIQLAQVASPCERGNESKVWRIFLLAELPSASQEQPLPNVVVKWLTLLHTREVPGSNLGLLF